MFAQLGIFIAVPLTIKFFLPIYSRLGIDTAYHYLEVRYNDKGLRILGALMFIIYQVGRMSIIMYLPSIVLAQLTGISVNLLIVVMGIIAIIYSYSGGFKIFSIMDRFYTRYSFNIRSSIYFNIYIIINRWWSG